MNSTITKEKNKINFLILLKHFFKECFQEPLFLITHPIRGFEEFKIDKKGKYSVAIFYLVMMILTQILLFNNAGFLVNKNNPKDFDLLLTIAIVIFPVFIGTVGNWSCTALMSGKGKMGDIFKVICYSFFPYVWLTIIAVIFSNFLITEEITIYNVIMIFGIIVTVYMMFFGLMVIHEYGLLKNIGMVIFTIVAIAVIIFICLLFLSLIQQFYSFISSVIAEFKLRFL